MSLQVPGFDMGIFPSKELFHLYVRTWCSFHLSFFSSEKSSGTDSLLTIDQLRPPVVSVFYSYIRSKVTSSTTGHKLESLVTVEVEPKRKKTKNIIKN